MAKKTTVKSTKKDTKSKAPAKASGAAKAKTKKSVSTKKKATGAKKTVKMTQREKLILKIKQDLLTQRESLLKEAEETLSTLPAGDINFPDMGDQATAETDRNFILRLRDRERMLLKKIEETIERIENGPYGKCEECENEIGIKRLEARPVTTLCIECKTRQEEDERIAEGG
jgi:DnaK suppressor protein